jgi:hypothetical protein
MLRFASENAGTDVWYISPTYKQSKAIMWEMMRELIPFETIYKSNEQELTIELINHSRIMLKGGDNPDSLRGVKIDFCVFDETAFFNHWTEVWKVVRPTLVDSKANVWFISTPNGFNHFKKLYETVLPDFKSFHFTTYDNPYLDKGEIDVMKQEMDEDSFAQEILGEFRKMQGLIYKEFNRDIHMVDVPISKFTKEWTFTRSLDFGFAHKSALGYFAISPNKDEIYMFDGLYQTRMFESEIAVVVKEKDVGYDIVRPIADSAQPMNIAQLFHEGVRFDPIDKNTDSVKNGIVRVAELLKVRSDTGKPTLMFNKNLSWVADEFELYRWIETVQDGVIKEVPYKVNDDACFIAGTKILTIKGNKRIEDIKVDDILITPFGNTKVISAGKTGIRKVNNYGCFICTPNHKIITNRGIVRVDAVGYNYNICKIKKQKQFTLMKFLIGGIHNQKTELIDFIFKGLLTRNSEAKRVFYIERYGNTIMAKFLLGLRSITLTAILKIMIFLISKYLRIKNMLKNIIGESGVVVLNILKKSKNLPLFGINQKREGGGIVKWLPRITLKENYLRKNAKSVKRNTKLKFLVEANTVIKTVKQQPYEEKEVYNLATDKGMYFANNILVSNCDMVRYFAVTHTKRADAEMFITKDKVFDATTSFVIGEQGEIPAINIKDFVGDEP